MYSSGLGVRFEREFFEFFERILNQMNRIFVCAIQDLKSLIHQIQSYFNPIQGFIKSTLALSDAVYMPILMPKIPKTPPQNLLYSMRAVDSYTIEGVDRKDEIIEGVEVVIIVVFIADS